MPTYEFMCPKCCTRFDVFASMAEKERGIEPACPKCGATGARQVFSGVNVLGTRRGNAPPCCPGLSTGCCPPPEN